MLETIRQDLRLAARLMWKERGFATATVATLALCLAANAAIFAIVNAVLLRPLPYPEADRLVTMFNAYPGAGVIRGSNAVPDYFDRVKDKEVFSELALYTWTSVTIGGRGQGEAERVMGMTVTPSFFRVLTVQPTHGRLFVEAETTVGQQRRVILSERLWRRVFPGRTDEAGADLRINGVPYAVVGVVPDTFRFDPDVELWMPAAFSAEDRADTQRHSNQWQMFGRLTPGATLAQAQRHIDALNARNLELFPQLKSILINTGFHTPVSLLEDEVVRDAKPAILLLWGGALVVLLIGCVNVVNLASVRASGRSREMATRLALGTTIGRLVQQTTIESLLLSVGGGASGLLLATATLGAINALGIETLPRRTEIVLDLQAVGYTVALVTLVAVLIGLWPVALRRRTLADILREEGRLGTPSRRARMIRRLLVTSQVAFALVLLMGAGLLIKSFHRVLAVDLGFRADHVLTGDINLPASRYARDPEILVSTDRILAELRRLPGVVTAGLTTSIPLGKVYADRVIVPEGHTMRPGESLISPNQVKVSEGYFDAMGVALLAGRFIDARDTEGTPRAAVIDEPLARTFWPGANPIGRRMYFPSGVETGLAPPPEGDMWLTVVGVVKPMRLRGIAFTTGSELRGTFFVSYRQFTERHVTLVLRTQRDPTVAISAVRNAIARFDPELAFYDVRPMDALVDRALVDRRTTMLLALGFAAVALGLSAIGIYGVLAYDIRQRTREIAIRIALGADRTTIVGMVLAQGAVVAAVGVLFGLSGAWLLRRTVESQLYQVGATDPFVVSVVIAMVLAVAIVACALPATRAASTDPSTALAEP